VLVGVTFAEAFIEGEGGRLFGAKAIVVSQENTRSARIEFQEGEVIAVAVPGFEDGILIVAFFFLDVVKMPEDEARQLGNVFDDHHTTFLAAQMTGEENPCRRLGTKLERRGDYVFVDSPTATNKNEVVGFDLQKVVEGCQSLCAQVSMQEV